MNKQLAEAVVFFQHEPAYTKLFDAFRKKYESLGRIGGTVSLKNFTEAEIAQIGSFFGLPGEHMQEKGSVALRAFEEQLAKTKFHSLHLKKLLDGFFGEEILSKKEQRIIKERALRDFFNQLQIPNPELTFWFTFLKKQPSEGRWLLQLAEKAPDFFEEYVALLHKAFIKRPIKPERLPMFSQRITGDPHAFDMQTDLGRMLLHILLVHLHEEKAMPTLEVPSSTEAINKLLQTYHLYRDDLLNFVTCANLLGETVKDSNPVWEIAAKEQIVQIIPLRELVSIVKAKPVLGEVVWVVENSGVCSTLLDYKPDTPMICTNGQFTLASLMLMDLLVKDGYTLYYASDLDPEGLGMAQRLINRYDNSLQLWQMHEKAYKESLSNITLSLERLEKLRNITDERLIPIAEKMQHIGRAGYQEALVTAMIKDIEYR